MGNIIKKKLNLLVFLIYFLYAIFLTFPLITNLNSYLIGKGGMDSFQYIWNIFMFWNQVSHLQWPFFTNSIFYPIGANLFFSDYSALTSLIALPFLKQPVLFINLITLLGISLSAFICFYLAKYITQNIVASLVAGFIYGFSPTMGSFIASQHTYYIIASAILPLGILMLLQFLNKDKKYLPIFFVVCCLMFFTSYYYFVLLIFISTILLVLSLRSLLFLIIPLFLILMNLPSFQNWYGGTNSYAAICNANILGLLSRTATNGDTPLYSLGTLFILTTILSIIFFRKEKFILAFSIGLVFVLLYSFGLSAKYGLYFWISKIPFLNLIDCPVRFVGGASLLIALILSISLAKIWKINRLVVLGIIILFLLSFLSDYKFPKFNRTDVYIPEVYKKIAEIKDSKTVLELPSGLAESKGAFGYDWSIEGLHTRQMYWQAIYQKPRIGGYTSRIPKSTYDFFKGEPIISDLFTLTSLNGVWPNKKYSQEEKEKFIQKFNLGYITIAPENRQKQFTAAVEQILEAISYDKLFIKDYILYIIR